MARKCFISFKTEDILYKKFIQEQLDVDMIDKSLNVPIESINEDYIMRRIREEYLADSTVTIHLIGNRSSENLGIYEQRFIKRELQASLYDGTNNRKSGILGVVLPTMYDSIYKGSLSCSTCGISHELVNINDSTVIKEFYYNYYLPNEKCSWYEDDRYCVLVKWNDFVANPNKFIEQAFDKRTQAVANKTKVRP